MKTINNLRSVKELLRIDFDPRMSARQKNSVLEFYKTGIGEIGKEQYKEYFETLDPAEQRQIKEFWGVESW